MEKKVIWELSEPDFERIENLYEKRLALENLSKIVPADNEKLYNKLITDYGRTMREYQNWWNEMSTKYNWEGNNWQVNFLTKEVVRID